MLKITAEEINFIVYQYMHESGNTHPLTLNIRILALCIYLFSRSQYSWKQVQSLPSSSRPAHLVSGEGTHPNAHGNAYYQCRPSRIDWYRQNDDLLLCNEPFSLLNSHYCNTTTIQNKKTEEIEAIFNNNKQNPSSTSYLNDHLPMQHSDTYFDNKELNIHEDNRHWLNEDASMAEEANQIAKMPP
jgi:hypothetical protein